MGLRIHDTIAKCTGWGWAPVLVSIQHLSYMRRITCRDGLSRPTDASLDGFEIVEHALDKLYSAREKSVGALTRAINHRKALRSPGR
jgi:hypothetical protein